MYGTTKQNQCDSGLTCNNVVFLCNDLILALRMKTWCFRVRAKTASVNKMLHLFNNKICE